MLAGRLRQVAETWVNSLRMSPSSTGSSHALQASVEGAASEGDAAENLEHFFGLSLDLFTVAGFDGYFRRLSTMWMKTLGWTLEELCAVPLIDFVHPEDKEVTLASRAQVMDGVPLSGFVNRYRCKDGSYRWLEWKSVAYTERVLVYAVARDITERRALEEERRRVEAQLVSAERMASVGRLAAGVAHEINNPLAFIMANLRTALQELRGHPDRGPGALPSDLEEMLSESLEGAERVKNIVRGLSTFSGMGVQRKSRLELRPVVEEAVGLLSADLRARAQLREAYRDTPVVEADASRLKEVLAHLLLNALQSIEEGSEATNEIRVATFTDAFGRAVVEIEDSGSGMSEATRSRIFDPFFTTKRVGTAAGLGLSICHTLVAELDGEIIVASQEGQGTRVRMELPPAPPPR